jgi:iron complex outermembrane recepter protein
MLQLNYDPVSNLTVTLQQRYRNALKQHGSPVLFFNLGKMPPAWYSDLTLTYRANPAGGNADLYLNVMNLFNRQPDHWAASGANAQIGSLGGYIPGDDIIGRYFTAGLRLRY